MLRRELANLRAAWRLARRRADRRRRRRDRRRRCSTRSPTATSSRSAAGPRSWPPTRRSPAHPRAAAVLGTAGEAAYHRGDHATAERLARAGLERVDRRRRVVVLRACRWRWSRWPAGRTPRSSSAASPSAERGIRVAARRSASPRSPAPTPATSTGRGTLQRAGGAARCRPRCARGAHYVAGEIESLAGHARGGRAALPAGHRPGPRRRARPSSSASPPSAC